jgi:hypothetical protein
LKNPVHQAGAKLPGLLRRLKIFPVKGQNLLRVCRIEIELIKNLEGDLPRPPVLIKLPNTSPQKHREHRGENYRIKMF